MMIDDSSSKVCYLVAQLLPGVQGLQILRATFSHLKIIYLKMAVLKPLYSLTRRLTSPHIRHQWLNDCSSVERSSSTEQRQRCSRSNIITVAIRVSVSWVDDLLGSRLLYGSQLVLQSGEQIMSNARRPSNV